MNAWENKLDNKYDVFVEYGETSYKGFLVIMSEGKELLREKTYISYGASFGPDIGDVEKWETKCIEFIDNLEKQKTI